MRVVDAYCGAGGWSAGAIAAGCTPVLGVDSDAAPLKLWATNCSPAGRAVCATIGADAIEWPEAAPDVHVHLSPPCTSLSKARGFGHPSWRRCTTPKGEVSHGKPSTGAPHHPAFGVRAHLRAHSGHARTKHVMCCARLSTPPKPTMPPRTAHPFRLSEGEITRAAFA